MSDYEHFKGKLTPVLIVGDLENTAKILLEKLGHEFGCHQYENYVDCLRWEAYQDFVVLDGKLYRISKKSLDPYDDMFNMTENEDGSLDFEVKYYNGGCSLDEALDEAFKKKEKK